MFIFKKVNIAFGNRKLCINSYFEIVFVVIVIYWDGARWNQIILIWKEKSFTNLERTNEKNIVEKNIFIFVYFIFIYGIL